MPNGLIHALILGTGLILLLRNLPRDLWYTRAFGIVLLEIYTLRYYVWRAAYTLPDFSMTAASLWQWIFFLAESLSILFACWSALVLLRRSDHTALATVREKELRKRPMPPSVTVLIATANEPTDVLEPTIRSAVAIDYPRKEVVVLDDDKGPKPGTRGSGRVHSWLPDLCKQYGVRYLRRRSSANAKAGNLNYGLRHTDGDVILVLDADFQAKTNILWRTVGLLTGRVALVQTPQHYFSSDPIQHNLGGEKSFTEEQRHFFDIVLPARDAWNNAVCVGTSFVVRRDALDRAGFPTGCLAEDVYGGYSLLCRGYEIRYLNEPLSYGSAADDLPGYITQRVRWCMGIIQALFLPYGPLRARGLRIIDRLFYLEMPLYWLQFFFLGLMLVAPFIYFWTGVPVLASPLEEAMSYVLPRIAVTATVGYWISQGKVMPVITEIRQMVCVFYILGGIVSVLLNPFNKPFAITSKGALHNRIVVHWKILAPFALLGVLVGIGLLRALFTSTGPVQWDEFLPTNTILALYVIVLLSFCCVACIGWPKDTQRNYKQILQGRWLESLFALVRGPSMK